VLSALETSDESFNRVTTTTETPEAAPYENQFQTTAETPGAEPYEKADTDAAVRQEGTPSRTCSGTHKLLET